MCEKHSHSRILQQCRSWISASCMSKPLKWMQNAAASLVLNLDHWTHITPALQQLHWLRTSRDVRTSHFAAHIIAQVHLQK